jgi:hypothetical protein
VKSTAKEEQGKREYMPLLVPEGISRSGAIEPAVSEQLTAAFPSRLDARKGEGLRSPLDGRRSVDASFVLTP